ncbi:MAG: hypothetical protein ABL984_02595 [Pyrinomonadaceae bacterium]
MAKIKQREIDIAGRKVTYTLELGRTDHNTKYKASVTYNGQTQDVSQNLPVNDAESEKAMLGLADVKVMQLHLEQFGDDEDANTIAKSLIDDIIEETETED